MRDPEYSLAVLPKWGWCSGFCERHPLVYASTIGSPLRIHTPPVDTLKWIHHDGKSELNANVNKIAVGGVMWFRDNSTPDPTTWAN